MGSYSWGHYQRFLYWRKCYKPEQGSFFDQIIPMYSFSNREIERFTVLDYFDAKAKEIKLQIGFESVGGFKSHKPLTFINFWPYQSQHPLDKAPIKKSKK